MTEKTDGNVHGQDEFSLQAELDRMAADVPEMPESFRKGWREAVRQDAGLSSAPARSASRRSFTWRRAVSIAAVFVFILGGTLLGQDALLLNRNAIDSPRAAVFSSVSETSADSGAEAAPTLMPDAYAAKSLNEEADSAVFEESADADEMFMETEAAESLSEDAVSAARNGSEALKADSAAQEAADAYPAPASTSLPTVTGLPAEAPAPEPAASGARPLRTLGWIFVGLSFVLAAAVLIFRKEKH